MTAPRYSVHARQRMQQRGISEQDVEHVIDNHDTSYTDRDGNPILIGAHQGRRIKVVIRKGSDPPFVITVAPRDE